MKDKLIHAKSFRTDDLDKGYKKSNAKSKALKGGKAAKMSDNYVSGKK